MSDKKISGDIKKPEKLSGDIKKPESNSGDIKSGGGDENKSDNEKDINTTDLSETIEEAEESVNELDDETKEPVESELEDLYPDNDIEPEFEPNSIAINLAFPDNVEFGEEKCYPPSYYTLSSKEKLILFYAENFRKQFIAAYPIGRRPLVLVVKNECDVEKFVCTTIRPTAFLHAPLVHNLEECVSFVADFIIYEPLENPIAIPSRLISPDTLLKRRLGNSFEMATLLCSMLIGAGFPAMVVSGIARHETTLNDQRDVICPFLPKEYITKTECSDDDDDDDEAKKSQEQNKCKYDLSPPPNTVSHLDEKLKQLDKDRAKAAQRIIDEEKRRLQEILDTQSKDIYHNRRLHAWIVIIENAQWSIKPRKKTEDEDGNVIYDKPTAYFIEPSTGFSHDTYAKNFIHVDSIWNHENYYINRQNCRPRHMEWDLTNLDNWEHFLPGEPVELRIRKLVSDENLADYDKSMVYVERHLDLLRSWVNMLHVGERDFKERYPHEQKNVEYQRCIHERFSLYSQPDGKISQITLYDNRRYETPTIRWIFYENRSDYLNKIKIDFRTKEVEESFHKGRRDCLKFYEHGVDLERPKRFHFYHLPRLDSLELIETYRTRLILYYKNRHDKCYYREYTYKSGSLMDLLSLTEKFQPNESIPADQDIAYRKFFFDEKKVFLKFQFAKNTITASNREFIFPPEPAYGHEYVYDPKLTKGYMANPYAEVPAQYELYQLLLKQLKYRKGISKRFDLIMEEILGILEIRHVESNKVIILFTVFDSLHNGAARQIRMKKFEDEEERLKLMKFNDPDFLAPYLVLYKKQPLTYHQSWTAHNACLSDLKSRFTGLLNGLQKKYEDLTAESKAIKKFLRKYEDQFDKFDYQRLVQDDKDLELNKRMVQQRLEMTHEEAQRKYEKVKNSLDNDPRLQLKLLK